VPPLIWFAVAVFVFQQVPAFLNGAGTWLDLVTPFVVLGAAALTLRDAPRAALILAAAAAVLYVDGHGIHLSANDVGHYNGIAGRAEDVRHFWDERFGHAEWHLGFLGGLAALPLADERRALSDRTGWVAALLLGWTLFASTVEGQDWWLTLGAAVVFAGGTLARPARTLSASALATLIAAALIGIWAAWHSGVPQFSDLGWL